jgi:glutathione synthase/RimK-type ligase-like ATP-grasp enzyme
MNQPVRNEVASRKAVQLALAAQLGMRVPRTLMTSDAVRARAFVEREGIGNVVYKTFAATHQVWRETRLFRRDDFDMLDSLRYAPVIFQEYVPAVADLRVTVVGAELFAMSIDARGTSYEVDFRVDMARAKADVAVLPDPIVKRLRRMMDRLGLAYGAIDLRHTDGGDYVFLEINPAGEFLFAEHGAGLPITDAVSRWLRQPF